MSFIDERLPLEVSINAVRREIEDIEIVTTDGGFEVRNIRSSCNIFEYDITYPPGGFDDAVLEDVIRMWKASRGGAYAFRFTDWDEKNNSLTAEVIGTGNGSRTAFQITKTWTEDGQSQIRNITRPRSAVSVFKDGVLQVSGFTVDYDTGIVTFSAAPANGVVVSITGLYDIPVRFTSVLEAVGRASFLEELSTFTLREIRE